MIQLGTHTLDPDLQHIVDTVNEMTDRTRNLTVAQCQQIQEQRELLKTYQEPEAKSGG